MTNDFCAVTVSMSGIVESTEIDSVIWPTCIVMVPRFMIWF